MDALPALAVVDGHNDAAWEARTRRGYSVEGFDGTLDGFDTDLPRLRAGGVGAQFWSVWVEDEGRGAEHVQETLEQIDWVRRLVARYPEHLAAAHTAAEVRAAQASGRIACLMGAEGGHQLGDSPAVLRAYARLGVRYLTLTHTSSTSWADSATDTARHGGLSDAGRDYVRELNRLGMLVDLSHVSPATMHAALDVTSAPVIFSHSSCRALNDHPRNVPDEVLRRLSGNGGIVMVTFVPQFLSADYAEWMAAGGDPATGRGGPGPKPVVTVADAADHVEHARAVAGLDHIGLGGDFDGADDFPEGLDGVDGYPRLFAELARRGWCDDELGRLASGNALRVLAATDAAFEASRS